MNQEKRHFTSHEAKNDEGGETHVESEEFRASEVEEQHEDESYHRYDRNEDEGVQESTDEFVPGGVRIGLGVRNRRNCGN